MEDNTPQENEEPIAAPADDQAAPPADEAPAEEPPAVPPEEDDSPEAQSAKYKSAWQRAMADYDNLKRDMERQRVELSKYACAGLVESLLPSLEAFRLAAAHEPKPAEGTEYPNEVTQWMAGIAAIKSQLDAALKQAGVEPIDEAGVPFNPEIHEAMMTKPVEGTEPGLVLEVHEAGCRLHDRVVKAAKVSVSE